MDEEERNAPAHLIRRIDRAFDAVTGAPTRSRRVPRIEDEEKEEVVIPPTVRRQRGDGVLSLSERTTARAKTELGGGFLPSSPPAAGGFLLDDREPEGEAGTHMPLSSIPAALQLLDLPPADEDVLEVFRNAAGGWDGSRQGSELGVSRKDWRAVCLALLPEEDEDEQGAGSSDPSARGLQMSDGMEGEESSEDEYRSASDEEDESMEDTDSEESYKQKTRKKGKGKAKSTTRKSKKEKARDSWEVPQPMTRRQKAACREAFGLFFPDVDDKELDSQRIMIKDVVRVSGLLKEKITADEVVEMLRAFSTSPDHSVSLQDFEQMMMAAKLA